MAAPNRGRRQERSQESSTPGIEDNVVKIFRCAKVVKGGRRFSFGALIVVGDRKGRVGVGYGKAGEVPSAVEKAKKSAIRNMVNVKLRDGTIPHRVMGRACSSQVLLIPASKGTGVIAGASVRAVLELAGVKDVLTKSYGSNTAKNLVRATFNALDGLLDREKIGQLRGVSIVA